MKNKVDLNALLNKFDNPKILYPALFIAFFLISLVVFGSGANKEFVHADDMEGIVNSEIIRDLGTAIRSGSPFRVVNAITYSMFELNPQAYHIRILITHSINVLLFFYLASLLFDRKTAFLAAPLFLVHPAVSEAVLWFSGSIYLFYTLFTFLTLILYVKFKKTQNVKFLIASAIIYALYLITFKSVWAFTTPIILIIIDQLVLREKTFFDKKLLKQYAYYIVPAILMAGIILYQRLGNRVETLGSSHITYVGKFTNVVALWFVTLQRFFAITFFPKTLTFFTNAVILNTGFYIASLGALTLTVALIVYFWKKDRAKLGLFLAMFAAILPTFAPLEIYVHTADRYFYLVGAFFVLLLVRLLSCIGKELKIKYLAIGGVILLFVIYSFRTNLRVKDWDNDEALWKATIETAPFNYKSHLNMGGVYFRDQNLQEALKSYEQAYKLNPKGPEAVYNIGIIFATVGDLDNAKLYMLKTYELMPSNTEPLFVVGLIEVQKQNYPEAKKYFERILEIQPDNPQAKSAVEQLNAIMSQ